MTMRLRTLSLWMTALALAAGMAGCSKDPTLEGGTPLRPYPLDRCLVSDEKLGDDPDMKPYVFVHHGQEIKLCCESCLKDFKKNPQLYLAKLPPVPPHPPAQP
jgi:hypothetical protein